MREANMAAPYMAMNVGGKRRKFAFFLTSETARPFRAELPELWPRLSEEVTDRIVEQTPGLDDLQRDFYKATLDARRKYVLGPAYRMAFKEAETSTATVGNDTLATDIVPGIPFPGLGETPVSCTEDSTRLTVREGPRSRRQSFPDRSMTVSRWSISSRHCRTA